MRRKRFTAHLADGRKEVCLASSADDVHYHFARREVPVTKVEPGDYRTQARRAAERAKPDGDWDFDLHKIRLAFEALTGLPLPERLRFEKGKRSIAQEGVLDASLSRGLIVRIRRTLSPADANEALWHELAHVYQAAREPSLLSFIRQSNAEHASRVGYKNRPSEREAREWQELSETDWLLNGERR